MDLEERIKLITREPTEEIVTNDELSNVLLNISVPKHYIGIEISGLLHLGSLILTGFKINDFMRARVDFKLLLDDWHTFINNNLGWDLDNIKHL